MTCKKALLSGVLFLSFLVPNYSAAAVVQTKNLTNQERVALIAELLKQVQELQVQLEALQKKELVHDTPITAADYTRGSADARIQILVFTDLECPFCQRYHSTLSDVIKNNPDVSVTYRHFPIEQLHRNAKQLAVTAECAGQIGGDAAFWKVVDSIFNLRSGNEYTDMRRVTSFVTAAGVSRAALGLCTEGQAATQAVEADQADGTARGVLGTPMSFVYKNGQLVETISGAYPLSRVLEIISNLQE
jgi:protein-disulfide isomerase